VDNLRIVDELAVVVASGLTVGVCRPRGDLTTAYLIVGNMIKMTKMSSLSMRWTRMIPKHYGFEQQFHSPLTYFLNVFDKKTDQGKWQELLDPLLIITGPSHPHSYKHHLEASSLHHFPLRHLHLPEVLMYIIVLYRTSLRMSWLNLRRYLKGPAMVCRD
jgi:hypothetical protein